MRAGKVDRIVFSSTAAVYGAPDRSPIPETAPLRPVNPYGASKLFVETMLSDFGAAFGLRSIALRYFNACGADPEGQTGEAHAPETHLIPLALEAAAEGVGVVATLPELAQPQLEAKRLVAPFDLRLALPYGYYLVCTEEAL
mgnify:CR=1 FL=1